MGPVTSIYALLSTIPCDYFPADVRGVFVTIYFILYYAYLLVVPHGGVTCRVRRLRLWRAVTGIREINWETEKSKWEE